jgi:hypothetical protein
VPSTNNFHPQEKKYMASSSSLRLRHRGADATATPDPFATTNGKYFASFNFPPSPSFACLIFVSPLPHIMYHPEKQASYGMDLRRLHDQRQHRHALEKELQGEPQQMQGEQQKVHFPFLYQRVSEE